MITRPGTTLTALGSMTTWPMVPTISGSTCCTSAGIRLMISQARTNASERSVIGVEPAWFAMPSTVTWKRLIATMAVTTPMSCFA